MSPEEVLLVLVFLVISIGIVSLIISGNIWGYVYLICFMTLVWLSRVSNG